MVSLKAKIDLFRRTQFTLMVGVAVFAVLFYLAAYRPRQSYVQRLSDQMSAARQDVAVSHAQTQRLPEARAELDRLRGQLAGYQSFPAAPDMGAFLGQLTQLSQDSNLRKVEINFATGVHQRGDLAKLPISLSFEGNFLDVCQFLHSLEAMHRVMRIDSTDVRAAPDSGGNVNVALSMDMYFSEQ